MQAASQQAVTWATVALEAVKYLGPAVLTLLGSLVALRHQRLSRQKELDAGAQMKARELIFNHYQRKLDNLSAESKALGRSFGQLQVLLHSPETDPGPALTDFLNSLISTAIMAKHDAEDAEAELKAFGLQHKYEKELGVIKQLIDNSWQRHGDLQQQHETLRTILFSLILVQEAILEARMKALFREYLPAVSQRSISIQ